MTQQFVHLNIHTEYSIHDSLVRLPELLENTLHTAMPALAITDLNNLFALVKFFKKAIAAGIKPIIGCDLTVMIDNEATQVILLCQNSQGFHHLTELISMAYLQGQKEWGQPAVSWQQLQEHALGFIALSGGIQGDIGKRILAGKNKLANERLIAWQKLFPQRFYLELQRTGRAGEVEYLQAVVQLAKQFQVPVVATNAVRFMQSEDFEAHEARVCIQMGTVLNDQNRPQLYTEQQYFRSTAEMLELFADIPSAIENTVEIAKRCSCILDLKSTHLPNFPVPTGQSLEEYINLQAQTGLQARLRQSFPQGVTDERLASYQQRLTTELAVINRMGFPGYFLIVADLISWAKQQKIPVGPGRGSGAGSLVAYALGITELDPIEHDLLFERFLNPERVSMPDFDIDFCMERRDRVIEYVAFRYGREAVSQIITFGTMAARAVVRDVGRVLSLPYGLVDKIAKLIPFEVGMTLEKALIQESRLGQRYQEEAEIKGLIDLALKLEGLIRNAGKHAGGVVIAPTKLTDFTPLYCESSGEHPVTQFDKDDVEAIGLVKFDFLGLRTLTLIDWAVQTINIKRQQQNESPLEISQIALDDKKTFQLLRSNATTAVFQLESRGMKDLIRRLRPDVFDEIVALVALFRPGPLQSGMVDDFIARKQGLAAVDYPHPNIKAILKPTYGVILYQEQVMQIAQTLAGYSLGEADLLRRAMGKKKPEEMASQRAIFMQGATAQGIEARVAQHIFDLMEKFAGYGFNRSHAAAYALIAYQTAWLKAHYPAEFMAAVLSSDMDNTDKVVSFLEECRNLGLKVAAPNVNISFYYFTVNSQSVIEYGLGAIKGVGEAAVENLIQERKENGPYQNLFDFCQRLDLHKISRRTLEPLIRSGALDCLQQDRAVLLANVERAVQAAEQAQKNAAWGQSDLFAEVTQQKSVQLDYLAAAPMNPRELLQGEKASLGLYFSGHPLQGYQQELKQFISAPIVELNQSMGQVVAIAGMLIDIRKLVTRQGRRMAVLTVEDLTGRMEITLFNRLFEEFVLQLQVGKIYVIRGKVEPDNFTGKARMLAESVKPLEQVRAELIKRLVIEVRDSSQTDKLLKEMPALIQAYRGGFCPIVIVYKKSDARVEMLLGKQWWVKPQDELLEDLRKLCPDTRVAIEY